MSPKQVYDQINQSGGVFESPSQGQELRDATSKAPENKDEICGK